MADELLFEKFRVSECLKKDDQSSVYMANHIFLEKDIILKTLNKDTITDPSLINRFKREARILARLEHPNIIKVLDFGQYGSDIYISFEYFAGQNLRHVISDNKLNTIQKKNLISQLVQGLAAAHSAGIIHRDLKPENILVSDTFKLKIADFGLAISNQDSRLTQKSSIVGTPGYMSPEQIRGAELNYASDLFAVGIIIYELFTGSNPFLGQDLNSTLNKILSFEDLASALDWQHTPEFVQPLLTKTLQKKPEMRARDAGELLPLLGLSQTAESKSSALRLVITIGLIIMFMVVPWHFIRKDQPDPQLPTRNESPVMESLSQSEPQDAVKIAAPEIEITGPALSEPQNEDRSQFAAETEAIPLQGNLFVSVKPAAKVVLNDIHTLRGVGDTVIVLSAGRHLIAMLHSEYPKIEDSIEIFAGKVTMYRVWLDTLFAYLHCDIYPWGEIFLNDSLIGQTPMLRPIRITADKYELKVVNPGYPVFRDSLNLIRGDTINFKLNLDRMRL